MPSYLPKNGIETKHKNFDELYIMACHNFCFKERLYFKDQLYSIYFVQDAF